MNSPLIHLPPPSSIAHAHSEALTKRIFDVIENEGGYLSFPRFMEMVLYCPESGYYSGGSQKFGKAGDFVTAPELTPLFGQTVARQIAELMQIYTVADVLEAGAGSGRLAGDILQALESEGRLPSRYFILELSGELRARQQAYLFETIPHLYPRVHWLNTLPEHFDGIIIGNEVLDAMPVHRVVWREGGVFERGVGCSPAKELSWVDRPADQPLSKAACEITRSCGRLAHALSHPDAAGDEEYCSEINLAARAWVASWSTILGRGALLLFDYGYSQQEYYLPERRDGTLMCHYRHHAHSDPFFLPGLQDITAHVDFTALADIAVASGFDLLGYTSQQKFLCNCGILHILSNIPQTSADYYRASVNVQKLIFPTEMGDLFKVIALGCGDRDSLCSPLLGFNGSDLSHTL